MGAQLLLTDPVVVAAFTAACSVLLVFGALTKLRDIAIFRYAVDNYRLLPSILVPVFAWLYALSELAAGLALGFASERTMALILAEAVVLAASVAVLVNLLRGRRSIECGCGIGGQQIAPGLLVRNLLLALAIWLASRTPLGRPLTSLDFFSWAGAALALLALYVCANQLLSNQQRLKELHS